MKIYTEEQVKQLLSMVLEDMTDYDFNEIVNESDITPIELPSEQYFKNEYLCTFNGGSDKMDTRNVIKPICESKLQGGNK